MKARWVYENRESVEAIGQAIVASWWPGRFYLVSTIHLESKVWKIWSSEETCDYVTQIYKCDKYGIPKDINKYLYKSEYFTPEEALKGHVRGVELLRHGKLKLIQKTQT